MTRPNQRGALSSKSPFIKYSIDDDTNVDFYMHFPAGNKSSVPGAGLRSQTKAAGLPGWTSYNPTSKSFVWRAGVCGDLVNGSEHLKGGQYYNKGQIAASYFQGGVIDVETAVTEHHNGYIEIHICDVKHCPGMEISPKCFQEGHCKRLNRAGNDDCESRNSTICGPMDPAHPSRWYFPCEVHGTRMQGWRAYGPRAARFRLPRNLVCDHCVLQWYWVAANSCNPPGTTEYFQGPRSPSNWGTCLGQGGAVGGYSRTKKVCGGHRIPEEYYQCSDIRIKAHKGPTSTQLINESPESQDSINDADKTTPLPGPSSEVPPRPFDNTRPYPETSEPIPDPVATNMIASTSEPSPVSSSIMEVPHQTLHPAVNGEYNPSARKGYGAIRDIIIVSNGIRIRSLLSQRTVDVDGVPNVTLEAFTAESVRKVRFRVYDSTKALIVEGTECSGPPFYLLGRVAERPAPWRDYPVNERLRVVVDAKYMGKRDHDAVHFRFVTKA